MEKKKRGVRALGAAIGAALVALAVAIFVIPGLTSGITNAQASVPQTITGTCYHECTNKGTNWGDGNKFNVYFYNVTINGKTYDVDSSIPHPGSCIDPGYDWPNDGEANYEGTWDAAQNAYKIKVFSEGASHGGVLGTDRCQNIGDFYWMPLGKIQIQKQSNNNTDATGSKDSDLGTYNFDGIKYTITDSDGSVVETLALNADGYACSGDLPLGDYKIEEIETNKWYTKTSGVVDVVTVEPGQTATSTPSDIPVKTKVQIFKSSDYQEMTGNNKMYSLAGAVYVVTDKTTGKTTEITTDENGAATTGDLLMGNYTVKEKIASPGFALDPNTYEISRDALVSGGVTKLGQTPNTTGLNAEKSQGDWTPKISKIDTQSKLPDAQGDATLAGAVYEIKYYDTTNANNANASTLKNTWYAVTDENGNADLSSVQVGKRTITTKINGTDYSFDYTSDALYSKDGGKTFFIPLGYVTIQEVLPSTGYGFDNGAFLTNKSSVGKVFGKMNTYVITGNRSTSETNMKKVNTDTSAESSIRGEIHLKKNEAGTNLSMPGIPFVIESVTTGEKHLAVTDDNGVIRTANEWNQHTNLTNGNDQYMQYDDENKVYKITDESKLDPNCGIYFTGYADGSNGAKNVRTVDNNGAFPYDTYKVTEVRCAANYGHDLVEKFITVQRVNREVPDDTWFDNVIKISTTALDGETNDHVGLIKGETIKLSDVVSYDGLTPGREYTMTGTIMDKATGKELLGTDGKPITASAKFTAEVDGAGDVIVPFEVPSSILEGKTIVVFEHLYEFGSDIAMHADINDDNQTIYYPAIHTTATDSVTELHEGSVVDEKVTVNDTVAYKGLKVGEEYKISGVLMDKSTGNELIGENGETFTAEKTFKAEETDGEIELSFEVPSSVIAGKTVVAFENAYKDDKLVAIHADIDDVDQTVHYPAIHTTATDGVTGDHEGLADDGKIVLNDEVAYENLTKGETYTVSGVLMDKSTGESIKDADGNEITSTTIFIAGEDNKKADSSADSGTDSKNDETDSTDKDDQTAKSYTVSFDTDGGTGATISDMKIVKDGVLTVPDGSTLVKDKKSCSTWYILVDKDTGKVSTTNTTSKYIKFGDELSFDDIAKLVPDGTSSLSLVAYYGDDQGNDEALDGDRVSGTVTVSFEFDASLVKGKQTVVFEDLNKGSKNFTVKTNIARHADINDEGQEVDYPELHTTATVDGAHSTKASNTIELVDTVTYTNLEPGKTYRVEGKLMNKADGGEIVDGTTNSTVTATAEFVPDSENGTTEVKFSFDGSKLANTDTVVFENLYKVGAGSNGDDAHVGKHEDLSDTNQTVHFDEADLASDIVETGDSAKAAYAVTGAALIALIAAGTVVAIRRVKNK